MSGSQDRWLLLHGTPLTPAVWDGVAAHLAQSGTVSCPAITPPAGARDAQGALAARLAAEVARRLPRATLQVLPGAAHMSPFTDPAALAQLILRAAERLPGLAEQPSGAKVPCGPLA